MQLPQLVVQKLERDGPYPVATLTITNTTSEPLTYRTVGKGIPGVDVYARARPISATKMGHVLDEHMNDYEGHWSDSAELQPNDNLTFLIKLRPDFFVVQVWITFITQTPERQLQFSSEQIAVQPDEAHATYEALAGITFDNLSFSNSTLSKVTEELNKRIQKGSHPGRTIKVFISPLLPKEVRELSITRLPQAKVSLIDFLRILNELTTTCYQIDHDSIILLPWDKHWKTLGSEFALPPLPPIPETMHGR